MLTKKQIESIAPFWVDHKGKQRRGTHTNSDLAKVFKSHCQPRSGPRQYKYVVKDGSIAAVGVKNRRDRRS